MAESPRFDNGTPQLREFSIISIANSTILEYRQVVLVTILPRYCEGSPWPLGRR